MHDNEQYRTAKEDAYPLRLLNQLLTGGTNPFLPKNCMKLTNIASANEMR